MVTGPRIISFSISRALISWAHTTQNRPWPAPNHTRRGAGKSVSSRSLRRMTRRKASGSAVAAGSELGVAGSAHLPRRVQEPPAHRDEVPGPLDEPPGFARAIARASHQ